MMCLPASARCLDDARDRGVEGVDRARGAGEGDDLRHHEQRVGCCGDQLIDQGAEAVRAPFGMPYMSFVPMWSRMMCGVSSRAGSGTMSSICLMVQPL